MFDRLRLCRITRKNSDGLGEMAREFQGVGESGFELDGGHIGYEIRPGERRQGFGSALLRLTLQEARGIGLSRVLLTAEPTNLGSIGVIQGNGGAFADTSVSPRTGREMNRYWIEL